VIFEHIHEHEMMKITLLASFFALAQSLPSKRQLYQQIEGTPCARSIEPGDTAENGPAFVAGYAQAGTQSPGKGYAFLANGNRGSFGVGAVLPDEAFFLMQVKQDAVFPRGARGLIACKMEEDDQCTPFSHGDTASEAGVLTALVPAGTTFGEAHRRGAFFDRASCKHGCRVKKECKAPANGVFMGGVKKGDAAPDLGAMAFCPVDVDFLSTDNIFMHPEDAACPKIYRPVCARVSRNGATWYATYSNRCEAENACQFDTIEGPCTCSWGTPTPPPMPPPMPPASH